MTQLLEDRPETVWAVLADPSTVPCWLSGCDAVPVCGARTPTWPAVGARLSYRSSRSRRIGRGCRVVTVHSLSCDPGRQLRVAMSRPLLGSAHLGAALAGTMVVTLDLEPAPAFRTGIAVTRRRFLGEHVLPSDAWTWTHRGEDRRVVTNLVAELRRRGPVMTLPSNWKQLRPPLPR